MKNCTMNRLEVEEDVMKEVGEEELSNSSSTPLNLSVVALMGLPGAGKTTLIKNIVESKFPTIPFNILHICYDDNWTHEASTISASSPSLKEQRNCLLKSIEQLIIQLKSSNNTSSSVLKDYNNDGGLHFVLRNNDNMDNGEEKEKTVIICDDNHYYRSMRNQLFRLCRKYQLNYAQIYIKCNLETALRRNAGRNYDHFIITEEIIRKMYTRFEEPENKHPIDMNNTLIIENEGEITMELAMGRILKFLGQITQQKPIKMKKREIEENSSDDSKMKQKQSLIHQLDLQMRKHIRKLLQDNKSQMLNCSEYAQRLNNGRKSLLRQFQIKTDEELEEEWMGKEELLGFIVDSLNKIH